MNDRRRTVLRRAVSILETVLNIVECSYDDEKECLNNMPENLEGSDRYEKMENAVEQLEDAISSIEDARDALEEAVQ